jgi:leucyl aminopeptidase
MPTFSLGGGSIETASADLLAVPVFTGPAGGPGADQIASRLGIKLKDLLEQSRIKGELGDAVVVPTLGKLTAKQVLFVGLGDKAKARAREIRKAGAVVAKRAGSAKTVATTVPQGAKGGAEELGAAFAEGFLLGSYRFDRYKASSNGEKPQRVESVTVIGAKGWDAKKFNAGTVRASVIADATSLARDLTNIPAMDKSPQMLADEAKRIAKGGGGVTVKVLDEKQLAAGGYGGLVGVGRGSRKPPRLVEITYKPAGAKKHIALVGKGITFDSGGLDIKTQGMDWMKTDMAGAAAVLGVMQAISKLKPKGVAVTGIVCTAENMPDGNALHAGDVLTIRGGKTVEVGNTDAEGRLVMSDGIVHAKEKGADVIVDIATLTGACMVALGSKYFGVFSNDDKLGRDLTSAADRAGELAWVLPLAREYRKDIDSDIADLKNIGGRYGGAITAALFLAEFAGDTTWAHLDIAGPARAESDDYEVPKGSTGAAVRTLVDWITNGHAKA